MTRLGLGIGLQYPRRAIGGGGGFNGIFNQFTGGAFGTSLRLLDSSYTGGLVRVRAWNTVATTDRGQADVMPYNDGSANKWVSLESPLENLDDTALARGLTTSHVLADLVDADGANPYNGFVPTIYEQLNGNHYEEGTATKQGNLISGGVLNTLNSKPIILRNSLDNDAGYLSNYAPNGTGKSLFYVGKNGNDLAVMLGSNTGADIVYLVNNGSTSTTTNVNNTRANERINGNAAVYSTRAQLYNLTTNQFLLSTDIDFAFVDNKLGLGYRKSNPAGYGMFSFQESVIWDNQLDRLAKETNTNNAFTIY